MIERRGKILRIPPPAEEGGKLARLRPRPFLKADPEELVHLDGSGDRRADRTD